MEAAIILTKSGSSFKNSFMIINEKIKRTKMIILLAVFKHFMKILQSTNSYLKPDNR